MDKIKFTIPRTEMKVKIPKTKTRKYAKPKEREKHEKCVKDSTVGKPGKGKLKPTDSTDSKVKAKTGLFGLRDEPNHGEVVNNTLRDLVDPYVKKDLLDLEPDDILRFPGAIFGKGKGWFRGEPITKAGKRRQVAKILTLVMTPILVLLGVSLYFVSDNVNAKSEFDRVRNTILFSLEVGKLIHVMQQERDTTVLYLSDIGPDTKWLITDRYLETDNQLGNLDKWPAHLGLDFDDQPRQHFASKQSFTSYLTRHRNELDMLNQTLYDEIVFYADIISLFVRWLYDAIRESKHGTVWKTLVAYQKIVVAEEDVGVERSLGSAYYSLGGFVSQEIYELYNQKLHVFRANIRAASRYSKLVDSIANARISSGGANLSTAIEKFRNAQRDLANEIFEMLDEKALEIAANVVISFVVIFVVLLMCPLLFKMIWTLTNDIQKYALTVAAKNRELNRERRRTDALLVQTLPRSVVDGLRQHQKFPAKFYRECTVLFSDVVDFNVMQTKLQPAELVTIVNSLYEMMDSCFNKFDVDQIESVRDTLMVSSGVPLLNSKHFCQIANVALDLVKASSEADFKLLPGTKILLRIGINSGPCIAGVVDRKLPRYCLFGDTVRLASVLRTNGQGGCIHVGAATQRLLEAEGSYELQSRGPINLHGAKLINGPMKMVTYWLVGRKNPASKRMENRVVEFYKDNVIMREEHELRGDGGKFHKSELTTGHSDVPSSFSPQPSTSQAYIMVAPITDPLVDTSDIKVTPESAEDDQVDTTQDLEPQVENHPQIPEDLVVQPNVNIELDDDNDFSSILSDDDRGDRCSSAERSILGSEQNLIQAAQEMVTETLTPINTPDINEAIAQIVCD